MKSFFKKYEMEILSISLIIIIIFIAVLMCVELIPLMKHIVAHSTDEKAVISEIYNYGIRGVIILIALQTLQIITAIFPSAAIQILAGLTYGIFYGLLICITGYILGNAIIFILVRQIDKIFAPIVLKHKKNRRKSKWDFSFLREANNATRIAFLLFLIPGIPNGILPYIFAKTKISLSRYLLTILIAATPGILLCSLLGDSISDGDIFTSVLVSGILILITLVVFISRNRIITFLKELSR